jgi:hypothetical protein
MIASESRQPKNCVESVYRYDGGSTEHEFKTTLFPNQTVKAPRRPALGLSVRWALRLASNLPAGASQWRISQSRRSQGGRSPYLHQDFVPDVVS